MAFNSMLRRGTVTVLPLAIRAVGSLRPFQRTISTVLSVDKHGLGLGQDINGGIFLPFSRFSTATAEKPNADESLIRVLNTEIDCAEKPHEVEDIPDAFPFEIEDNSGERTIFLKRKFQDEAIKVEVDMPSPSAEDDDNDHDEDDDESSAPPSIPLVVSIAKGSGQSLEFGITAFPDEITIDSLSIKHPESSDDQLAYEGPDFSDLDENLQKAFHKYLEIRGIKPSTTNFLFEYMTNKDNKEYLQWLQNLKNFVEK